MERKKTPQERYDEKMIRRVQMKLNKKYDADILEVLDQVPKKQTYIKEAIRFYMEHKDD